MQLTLYHYVHCPFCIRVRMALGFLNLAYKSVVLPYHDEKTPVSLTQKKMLPILEIDGVAMNESLDLIKKLDQKNILGSLEAEKNPAYPDFLKLLDELAGPIHNLAMPYWIWTPEFDAESRVYFQKKKEVKRGPFKDLVKKAPDFIQDLQPMLLDLTKDLVPFYKSSTITIFDVMLASHLWGLYVVPEFQFPDQVHHYLQEVKRLCHFNYHEDFWK